MKKNIYEIPVMTLKSFGIEDVVCGSGNPQADPHFVKGNNATATAGSKTYAEAAVAFSE